MRTDALHGASGNPLGQYGRAFFDIVAFASLAFVGIGAWAMSPAGLRGVHAARLSFVIGGFVAADLLLGWLVMAMTVLAAMWWFDLRRARVRLTRTSRAELNHHLTAEQLEQWCTAHLRAQGYRVRRVRGSVDDRLAILAEREGKLTLVHCRRNSSGSPLSGREVQDLLTEMRAYPVDAALLIRVGRIL